MNQFGVKKSEGEKLLQFFSPFLRKSWKILLSFWLKNKKAIIIGRNEVEEERKKLGLIIFSVVREKDN